MYDVRKISFFLPPCHCHKSADFVPFICFLETPSPTHCGRHIWKPPNRVSVPAFGEQRSNILHLHLGTLTCHLYTSTCVKVAYLFTLVIGKELCFGDYPPCHFEQESGRSRSFPSISSFGLHASAFRVPPRAWDIE